MPEYGSDGPNVREDLAPIRAAVEAGNTDLRALGFWRLVARIKRDPALIEALANDVGEIDRLAFERRFRIRLPVWLGNATLFMGTLAMVALLVVAIDLADPLDFVLRYGPLGPGDAERIRRDDLLSGVLLLVAGGGLSVTVHDLSHWAVGTLGGIRFSAYFLDGPFRVQPGLKIEYASYLRADPRARARMHAAGAVASKAAPFAVFAVAYAVHWRKGWELFPEWSLWAVLGFGLVQILTDVVWSTKKSDWKRWRRERRIAADLYSKGTPGSSDVPG